ncbi:MAG TPA: tetratricopeptide repeat protein [Bacteroidia bacterium]|jgi:tetratricopeptide (TPR) repeat protein|nr:tetratricopeptide repeat protein [Bacteroidia bacterium]
MKKAAKKVKTPSTATHPKVNWAVIFKPAFLAAFFGLVFAVSLTYSGHFNNPFHFDDDHTIVSNKWIRQLDSFPRFFYDATTTSSLPRNQAYRPGVTLLHAIDYHLSVDTTSAEAKAKLDSAVSPIARAEIIRSMLVPKPYLFHVHIFIGFLLSGFLLFFVLLHIFNYASPEGKWNEWLALFGMGWFWLHTANAETINYISARSDSASTFWILLTFVIYFYSNIARRFHLYLLPMIVGFFIKEPAIMFAPLMLVFIALFETEKKPLIKFWFPIATAFFAAMILFSISRSYTPTTWDAGGTDPFHYLLTEAFVIVHYVLNFFFPFNLSADTDWAPVTRVLDDKVILGGLFIAFLVFLIVICWRKREWRPVSFGIIWFLVALAPTSSIFPFAEVLNDHRTYFPYIGLIIACVQTVGNLVQRFTEKGMNVTRIFAGIGTVVLVANGIGAHERCNVWSSGFNLWSDCVQKSPANGRAWMQYGMTLFEKGNDCRLRQKTDSIQIWYDSADVCYNKAKYYLPAYSYLFINMGVLRQWEGKGAEAETDFRTALACEPGNPEPYFYLADYLRLTGKTEEAYTYASQGLQISPDHEKLQHLMGQLQLSNPWSELIQYNLIVHGANPRSDDYVNLSLAFYNLHAYESSAEAARNALKLDSANYVAWNNLCSAENTLGHYDVAALAGMKALGIRKDFPNAAANVAESNRCMHIEDSLTKNLPAKPSYADYINMSLAYYNSMMYIKCVEAANKALELKPNDAVAYNNICCAYNQLKQFPKAVAAGNNAVKYNTDPSLTERAKNNLATANAGLAQLKTELAKYSNEPVLTQFLGQ